MAMLNDQMVQQIDLFEHMYPSYTLPFLGVIMANQIIWRWIQQSHLNLTTALILGCSQQYCHFEEFPILGHTFWIPETGVGYHVGLLDGRIGKGHEFKAVCHDSDDQLYMEIVLDVFFGGTTHHCYYITSISWWIRSDVPICCWLKPHHSDDDPGSFFGLFLTHGVLLWAIGSFQPHAIGSSLGFWSHRKLDGSSHEQQTAANFDHWPSRVGPHLGLLYDFILRHHK